MTDIQTSNSRKSTGALTWLNVLAVAAMGSTGGSVFLSRRASAHSVLTAPLPRVAGMPGSGLVTGPCGAARTAAQPVTAPPLTPGAQLLVTWSETINHPGCFHIDFAAAGDLNFQPLVILPHSTAGALPRPYSMTVTLPTTPCAACTLRVRQIQLAADPAAGTCPETGQTTYFSCANVVLGDGGGDAGVPAGTGGASATGSGGGTSTGGRTGSAGQPGSGGQGQPGTGGQPATTGTGGAAIAGGSGGRTGSGSGGATGVGTTGSGGTTVGSGGSAAPAGPSSTEGGCACDVAPATPLGQTASLVGLGIALALAVARRKARNRATRP